MTSPKKPTTSKPWVKNPQSSLSALFQFVVRARLPEPTGKNLWRQQAARWLRKSALNVIAATGDYKTLEWHYGVEFLAMALGVERQSAGRVLKDLVALGAIKLLRGKKTLRGLATTYRLNLEWEGFKTNEPSEDSLPNETSEDSLETPGDSFKAPTNEPSEGYVVTNPQRGTSSQLPPSNARKEGGEPYGLVFSSSMALQHDDGKPKPTGPPAQGPRDRGLTAHGGPAAKPRDLMKRAQEILRSLGVEKPFELFGKPKREWDTLVSEFGADRILAAFQSWAERKASWLREKCEVPAPAFVRVARGLLEGKVAAEVSHDPGCPGNRGKSCDCATGQLAMKEAREAEKSEKTRANGRPREKVNRVMPEIVREGLKAFHAAIDRNNQVEEVAKEYEIPVPSARHYPDMEKFCERDGVERFGEVAAFILGAIRREIDAAHEGERAGKRQRIRNWGYILNQYDGESESFKRIDERWKKLEAEKRASEENAPAALPPDATKPEGDPMEEL